MAHLFNKGIYYITNGTDPNTLGLVPTNNAGLAKTEDGSSTWRYDDALPTNKWVLDNLDKFHSNIVATAPYDPLLPLSGWVAPSSPISGNTVEVKFTDGTVANYTYDGTVWIPDFQQTWAEQRICLNTATPPFIQTIVTGQQDATISFNFDGNPFDITSFKINSTELLSGAINIYDGGGNYVYTNQLVPLFNAYMGTNGYTGTLNDDIDNNLEIYFENLTGMTSLVFFEIITNEGGNVNTYSATSPLISVSIPADLNNPLVSEVDAWAIANLTLQQRENGTQLVYFVPGDGGSCDVPDYEWTLNKGSQLVTLSNKEEKTNAITYVDNIKGSDIIGKKQYPNFPFKTFNSAAATLVDGDWLQYWNTDESISGTNILPTLTKYNFDFGKGDITINAGGNAFIGHNNFTDILIKDINIKNSGIFTSNKTLQWARYGNITIDLNTWITNNFAFVSKGNVDIKVNDLTSTLYYPLGFFSPSNKNVNVDIQNVTVNSSQTGGYVAGLISMEVASSATEDTENNFFNVKLGNVKFNSSHGCVFYMYSYGGAFIKNSIVNLDIDNFNQHSTYTSYPNGESSSRCLLRVFAGNYPKLDNIKLSLNVKNQDSDISVLAEGNGGVANVDNCTIFINVDRSVVRKLSSFQFSTQLFNNTKETIKGNYTNLSTRPIIDIINLELTNNSIVEFDGTFKANTNVSLTGLTIDATSKIVFKGRYELGNGFFDISGVTGAGADNVYFEDCTIVTNNVECIVSGTAKNVKILDVRSNKPTSANVTELVSSIIVNSVIN